MAEWIIGNTPLTLGELRELHISKGEILSILIMARLVSTNHVFCRIGILQTEGGLLSFVIGGGLSPTYDLHKNEDSAWSWFIPPFRFALIGIPYEVISVIDYQVTQ